MSSQTQSTRPPRLDEDLVRQFVIAAHGRLNLVEQMLEDEPSLVNATVDWGGGDWETALGGASHMGNRDIAKYLLSNGARKDIFCAAMLRESDVVRAFVKADPGIVKVRGPHRLTLFYHVGISGDIELAEFLFKNGADGVAGALHSAAREGNEEMVRWLLKHGSADDINVRPVANQTALEIAIKQNHEKIVDLLKQYGAEE